MCIMNNESGYQYDRCISRGICSINPTTASLQEVIILYLKNIAFYGLKLEEAGINDEKIYNLVLNTISILSSSYEISVQNFKVINSAFQTELPRIINIYENLCSKNGVECEKPELCIILDKTADINDYIRLGEKEFNKRINSSTLQVLNLYRIMFILVKSMTVNMLVYESYGHKPSDEFSFILKILNLLNFSPKKQEELKSLILEAAKKDCELMSAIRSIQEERYGNQEQSEVSFSTKKGKAIMVVGSNIRELENVLEEFKNTAIDVYTHDNMMLAHTFPKFKEYKNLKGQYGKGMENCLLDFSTFPGPIILTKNSLYNVENLYRGTLFTTDFAYSKGVIPIINNDFSKVIKSAENSRGFKSGKECIAEKTGFSYENLFKLLNKKLNKTFYKQVIIIGARGYSSEEKEYFKKLIKHVPKDIFVISMSCCDENENILCLNTEYDNLAVLKISDYVIGSFSLDVNVFFPYCDRHTLTMLLFLSSKNVKNIFVGTKNQTILKPNILDGLKTDFNVLEITTPKKDLSLITENT